MTVRNSIINSGTQSTRRSNELSQKDYMITSMRNAMSSIRDKLRP